MQYPANALTPRAIQYLPSMSCPNNAVPPSNPSVPVNQCLDNTSDETSDPTNIEVAIDPFDGMHHSALDHLIKKRSDLYPI